MTNQFSHSVKGLLCLQFPVYHSGSHSIDSRQELEAETVKDVAHWLASRLTSFLDSLDTYVHGQHQLQWPRSVVSIGNKK